MPSVPTTHTFVTSDTASEVTLVDHTAGDNVAGKYNVSMPSPAVI